MTIAEMHTEIKFGVDKADSFANANFLPEEIDIELNNQIEIFVSQRAYGTNPKGDGLEETQKRTDDLRNLVTNTNITTFTNNASNKTNGLFVTTPSDYLHAIQEECTITYPSCNVNIQISKKVPVIAVTHDRYNKIINDPFNKPDTSKVIRLGFGKSGSSEQFELITDPAVTVNTYHLRYLKQPDKVRYGTTYTVPTTDVDCNLSPHTHKELIRMTVTALLANIASPQFNISKQQQTELE